MQIKDAIPSLFSVLPPEFFNVLSSQNKEDYYKLLVVTNSVFGNDEFVDRDDLVRALSQYIQLHNLLNTAEATPGTNPYQTKASSFVNYLKSSGWLQGEPGEDWSERLYQTEGFTKMMPVLQDLAKSDYSVPEYTRYITTIKNDVFPGFDFERSTDIIEEIGSYCDYLGVALKEVNQKLKRFINDAIGKNGNDPAKIVNDLLYRYPNTAPYLAFQNLTLKNNYAASRAPILEGLSKLEDPAAFKRLVENYIKSKHWPPDDPSFHQLAESTVHEILDKATSLFESFGDFISEIERRNGAYVKTAVRRVEFEFKDIHDIEGLAVEALKKIKPIDDDDFADDFGLFFDFPERQLVDSGSLQKPISNEQKVHEPAPFVSPVVTPEDQAEAEAIFDQEDEYSSTAIFDFVRSFLEGKSSIKASEVSLKDEKDLAKLLLAVAYSTDGESFYEVTLLPGEVFNFLTHEVDNFLIKPMEVPHE